MAGHSKWANIKHRKGKADAKKGKIFSRIAKEIISAVKLGGVQILKTIPVCAWPCKKPRAAMFPMISLNAILKKPLAPTKPIIMK